MKAVYRVAVVAGLAVAVAAVVALKTRQQAIEPASLAAAVTAQTSLPRLVDLGAGKCIPCRMMAPILEELATEYADTFTVEFIDVAENPDAGKQYGIRVIPTQIFYDGEGIERFRHEGFFGKAEILAKWGELEVTVVGAQ